MICVPQLNKVQIINTDQILVHLEEKSKNFDFQLIPHKLPHEWIMIKTSMHSKIENEMMDLINHFEHKHENCFIIHFAFDFCVCTLCFTLPLLASELIELKQSKIKIMIDYILENQGKWYEGSYSVSFDSQSSYRMNVQEDGQISLKESGEKIDGFFYKKRTQMLRVERMLRIENPNCSLHAWDPVSKFT